MAAKSSTPIPTPPVRIQRGAPTATPVRRGRTVLVERVELTGPDGREMAEGTFTMYRVSSEPPARLR